MVEFWKNRQIRNTIQKIDWKMALFLLVVALAVFLRVWHFSDWLFFKMDQARDASTIKQAYEMGPGWLPLLGPKAGGTELNLGPAFYYFQYLTAIIFHSTHPAVLAIPDLLFGILSIPLFYFFLKKYFSRDWSLILAGLYSICFLGIQYSRFAWNPNSLPFFNLLYFYSLLNIFDDRIRYRLRWIVLAGISFAVSTQLHFLSFLTLPIITLIFIVINWKEFKKFITWKHTLVFLIVIFLVYMPVFFNEYLSHGENTMQFIKAIKEKPSHHTLWQNIKRNFRYFGQNWLLMLTSYISKKGGVIGSAVAWLGMILPATFLGWRYYRKEPEIKKKFLLISLLWFWVYFLAYIPIAYQIRPRFFLPMLILPFIFVGYLAIFFWKMKKKYFAAAVVLALAIIFVGNLYGTYLWFNEIKAAEKKGTYPWRTIILKAKDGIVLWHLEGAVNYMRTICPAQKIYYDTSAEYGRPIKYLLDEKGIESGFIDNLEIGSKDQCVFGVRLTRAKEIRLSKEIKAEFNVGDRQKFGALSVYPLSPKEEFFGQNLSSFRFTSKENPSRQEELERSNRIFWKDVWK